MTATPLPPDPLASVDTDLAAIDALPLAEQAAIFEQIHRTISRVLDGTVVRGGAPQAPSAGEGR